MSFNVTISIEEKALFTIQSLADAIRELASAQPLLQSETLAPAVEPVSEETTTEEPEANTPPTPELTPPSEDLTKGIPSKTLLQHTYKVMQGDDMLGTTSAKQTLRKIVKTYTAERDGNEGEAKLSALTTDEERFAMIAQVAEVMEIDPTELLALAVAHVEQHANG